MEKLIVKSHNKYQHLIQIGYFKRDIIEVSDIEVDHPVEQYDISFDQGKLALCYKKPVEKDKISQGRFTFAFYEIEEDEKDRQLRVRKIGELLEKKCNEVRWSRSGQMFILVNKDPNSSDQGILEIGYLRKGNKPQ